MLQPRQNRAKRQGTTSSPFSTRPPTTYDLELNRTVLGNIETPYSVDHWTFSGASGQVVQFSLLGKAAAGIVFTLTGPDGWIGFQNATDSSGEVILPVAGDYTLTARSTAGGTGSYAFRMNRTDVVDLELNVPFHGALVGRGVVQVFRIEMAEAAPLFVKLDDDSYSNWNELYVSLGAAPTRSDYDYHSSALTSSDQSVLVPTAAPGVWYVLVYADSVPVPGDYTIVATNSRLGRVTPNLHGNGADMVLTISGSELEDLMSAELVASDGSEFCRGGEPSRQPDSDESHFRRRRRPTGRLLGPRCPRRRHGRSHRRCIHRR